MKNLTPRQQLTSLTRQLTALHEGISQSLQWVDTHRHDTPRLALEADMLSSRLSLARGQSEAVLHNLMRPTTLALYGQSQAGKAWLLREMLGDAQGQLLMRAGDRQLDVFNHINPGNTDFAVAVRYSHQPGPSSVNWPVELELLSEADITRMVIAAHTFHRGNEPDAEQLERLIKKLQRHQMTEPVSGLNSDVMLRLRDWFAQDSRRVHSHFARCYWPQAMAIAPRLSVDDRAQLFAPLWQNQQALTHLWRQLVHLRHQLHQATRVRAQADILTDASGLPAELFISPQAAVGLNQAQDTAVEVCPMLKNRMGKPQTVPLALLALLSAEMLIPLRSVPRQALWEQSDIVDIPAVGTPAEEESLSEQLRLTRNNPLASLLLNGKRAILLNRYAERQLLDIVLVCTAASRREDADAASRLLRDWLARQPAGESGRPRLIWAITPYDSRHRQANIDEAVQRQVGGPGESRGSMLALDSSGVQRMTEWLEKSLSAEDRRRQLVTQYQQLRQTVFSRLLAPWTQATASEVEMTQRQHIADTLLKCLQHRTGLHGELLERLQPEREQLRQLWITIDRHPDTQGDTPATTAPGHFGIGFEFDLFNEGPADRPNIAGGEAENAENRFARLAFQHWLNHLRQLPDNASLLQLLNIEKPVMEWLVDELITASFRLNILRTLEQSLHEPESRQAAWESRADRQVSRVMTITGDFVAWLGYLQCPESERPQSRVNRGQPIFARPPAPGISFSSGRRLTRLSATPASNTAFYIYDWLVGLNKLVMDNSDHAGGSGLTESARKSLALIQAAL